MTLHTARAEELLFETFSLFADIVIRGCCRGLFIRIAFRRPAARFPIDGGHQRLYFLHQVRLTEVKAEAGALQAVERGLHVDVLVVRLGQVLKEGAEVLGLGWSRNLM